MYVSQKHRRHKRHRANDDDDNASDDDESPEVIQIRNRVYFHCPVTRKTVLALIQKLEEAETYALTNEQPSIYLFIHSEGGDAYAGLSAMNHVQTRRLPVDTVADGFVASAATFILLGGRVRYGMRHAAVLIHQLTTGFWGKFEFMKDEVTNSAQLMDTFRDLYTRETRMKKKKVNKVQLFMNAYKYRNMIYLRIGGGK